MRREDVLKGVAVRLAANYMDVPRGTLATVETVGMLVLNTWGFTVRWRDLKPPPQRKHRYPCSLNLWESDLELFEVVTDEERAAASVQKPSLNLPNTASLLPYPQGKLPLEDG